MLFIKPIQEKARQEELCRLCGIPYRVEAFAYAAYSDDVFVGLSQFSVCDEYGILYDLVPAPGTQDMEALFIMGRQTLNWIDLLGIHTCRCPATAGPANVLRIMGFTPAAQPDTLTIDMTHLFEGHCGGHCDIARDLRESTLS